MIEPSIWANLMTSACWAVTARMTISCCPLRVVPGCDAGPPLPSSVVPPVVAVGGGSSVPRTCMPWRRSLTLVLLRPADDGDRGVGRVDRDDRELVAGEADDHVDVVAGLDDGADAA